MRIKCFVRPRKKDDFLAHITIDHEMERRLKTARDIIRQHVREGVRNWERRVVKDELFEMRALAKMETPALQPKFREQGSFAYKTVNDPAHKPLQEVDFDDGLFLPVAFFEKNGASSPAVASKGFFKLIEAILKPLCDRHGWELDTSKPSCVRVKLFPGAHYDMPLYAVADEAFAKLVEKRAQKILDEAKRSDLADGLILDESIYRELGESEIRLAHRDEGWIDSDPRKIDDWFHGAVRTHGPQVRRVSRYLKAWRDYNWPDSDDCKLSSISIMQCAVTALDTLKSKISQSRDDIALFEIVKKLPDYFQGDIQNPVIEGQVLNDNWTYEKRIDYVEKARVLRARVTRALQEYGDAASVLREFRNAFGPRIPDNEALITFETSAAVIRSYEPAKVPQPNVKRSTSG